MPQTSPALVSKFAFDRSGLELERRTQLGSFFDTIGRRSAVYGYENQSMEAWVHPLKLVDDLRLAFRIEGYPLEIPGPAIQMHINVRPEATTFTYSHTAFTVRQIIFAPVDEPGIVMLLDVKTTLPLLVRVSFRPQLRLSWPAGLQIGNLEWDRNAHVYYLTEESQRFVGIIGSPLAQDISVQPYQEEPRDVPAEFLIEARPEQLRTSFIPIVIAAGIDTDQRPALSLGAPRVNRARGSAKQTYDRLLGSAEKLYQENVAYYRELQRGTVSVETPDERFNRAFAWAKTGVDKGFATNPTLGTGLLAGFRTSGNSERPGFAWFFGRDALWTALALVSYGDFAGTRTALDFLRKFQRQDGKIPHEISQSAALIPWFTEYEYPWASADATPLYVITQADYWRASGDTEYLRANWDAIKAAYRFTLATDTDGNGLIENTRFGHGWVEGGALYPPHEEIYMQGVWVEACTSLAELAGVMNDPQLAVEARAQAERTRQATEATYWLANQAFYAFATQRPRQTPAVAEPGPELARRQARLNELQSAKLFDEDTVLPAVPLWWHTLDGARAQTQIDHLGSNAIATDWGARIISNRSRLYDPLSYHYGSVWPLFTGWASMGAYAYGRPHVGHQALMANALLTYTGALGYVTELLSGDFNVAFGRSSHHQVWSEAMVVTPTLRGMLGLAATGGGRTLRFAPQLPADWNLVSVRGVAAGDVKYDFTLGRGEERQTINVTRRAANEQEGRSKLTAPSSAASATRLVIAPAFPLDAQVRAVAVNGRAAKFDVTQEGDVQRASVRIDDAPTAAEVVFTFDEGTDVYVKPEPLVAGATSQGLRIIRVQPDAQSLRLTLEGLGSRQYTLGVRTPHRLTDVSGAQVKSDGAGRQQLLVSFDGAPDTYVRREFVIPLQRAGKR